MKNALIYVSLYEERESMKKMIFGIIIMGLTLKGFAKFFDGEKMSCRKTLERRREVPWFEWSVMDLRCTSALELLQRCPMYLVVHVMFVLVIIDDRVVKQIYTLFFLSEFKSQCSSTKILSPLLVGTVVNWWLWHYV